MTYCPEYNQGRAFQGKPPAPLDEPEPKMSAELRYITTPAPQPEKDGGTSF